MKYNTRFNPTPSGELHLGHLFVAMVNHDEARRSKGTFAVRIDDSNQYWNHTLGKDLTDQYCAEYKQQLSFFLTIDRWERQSLMPTIQEIRGDHPLFDTLGEESWMNDKICEWIPDSNIHMYPYQPLLTVEKVLWDFYEGINWLIRGEDIVTETALYQHFVDILGLPRMIHTYLPRLRAEGREDLRQGGFNLSKTKGNYQLQKQIDYFGVEQTLEQLKQCCLIDPSSNFYVENVKWNPVVVGFEK
ncbi:MAG: glutamate--tRNA ligase family protein [Candidatus Thorarchaeota archaeon]